MKKQILGLALLAWILSGGVAFATVGLKSAGTPLCQATDINISTGMTATCDGSTGTISGGAVGTDGNWTSDGLTVSLDLAPTKFIATASSGNFSATGFTAGTGDIALENGQTIDGGTNNSIKFGDNSDTATLGFDGSDVTFDTSDGGLIFLMTQSDGNIYFKTSNDSDDYMLVKTVTNVPTIATLGTSDLTIAPDSGNTNITGTATISGVATSAGLTTSSTITLANSETIVNSTNNTVEVGGGTNTVLSVLDTGTADSDAMLLLRADASADNGDDWRFTSDGATNSLLIENDTSGSQVTKLTIATTGDITTTGDVQVSGTTPLVTIGDGGDEDTGIQINSDTVDFYIASENSVDSLILGEGSSIGTTPIITLATGGATTVTGATNGSLTVLGAGTSNGTSSIVLSGDAAADATDDFRLQNDAAGNLVIANDTASQGTYVSKLTLTSAGAATLAGTTNGILTIIGSGTSDGNSTLLLQADNTADNGDDWQIVHTGSTNAINIQNDTSGSQVTKLSVATTGALTSSGTTDGLVTILGSGTSDGDATLLLQADNSTDNADDWQIQHDGATNNLIFQNDTSGSQVTKLTLTTGGVLTTSLGTVHNSSSATALTPGAAVTLTVVAGREVFTDTITTDNQDQTITFSGAGSAGDTAIIIFQTDAAGSGDEVITFHATLCNSAGTLTLANAAADRYVVSFVSDGTIWNETSRTAIQVT